MPKFSSVKGEIISLLSLASSSILGISRSRSYSANDLIKFNFDGDCELCFKSGEDFLRRYFAVAVCN